MPAADASQQLYLRSDLSELRRVDEWMRHWGEQLSLRQETINSIHLCLIEAVTNVIAHGGLTPSQSIALVIQNAKDVVTVRVTDGGLPFDPLGYVVPPKPESLQESKIGGHGIRLMRRFATQIGYERKGDRNCLTLIFAS
jgi:serine/threonine-protein kinase RsbW